MDARISVGGIYGSVEEISIEKVKDICRRSSAGEVSCKR
jgi:hypothetical protein